MCPLDGGHRWCGHSASFRSQNCQQEMAPEASLDSKAATKSQNRNICWTKSYLSHILSSSLKTCNFTERERFVDIFVFWWLAPSNCISLGQLWSVVTDGRMAEVKDFISKLWDDEAGQHIKLVSRLNSPKKSTREGGTFLGPDRIL